MLHRRSNVASKNSVEVMVRVIFRFVRANPFATLENHRLLVWDDNINGDWQKSGVTGPIRPYQPAGNIGTFDR